MRAFEVVAEIDEQRCLRVVLPEGAPPGPARVLVLVPDRDDPEAVWAAREWADELADERQDIYTLEDGEPVDAAR